MSKVLGSAPGDAQVQQLLLRRADEGLVAGDGTVRQILDALPAAVYVTDSAGQITYYNEAAATLWGHRPEIGKFQWCGFWKLYRADGMPLAHDHCPMATSLREMRAAPGAELIAERPDGSRVVFMPYPRLLYDASGALIGAVNMLVDLTDHKRAEANAQQLASIVEFSNDAIIGEDLDGVITSWNRGAERIYGYTAQEVIGKPVTILMPPEFRDEEPKILERIRRGEVIDHYETVRQHRDGRRLDISLTVSPVKDANGRIIGASKIARDVTERQCAEQTAQRLASIVESSDDAILAKDLDGMITSWNQGAERLFGYTAEEAIGRSVTILIPADRPDEEPAILARLRRGEPIDHYETTRQRKDGSLVEISLSVSPIRNSEGRVVGASKIARDITERRRAEERQQLLLREMDHRVKNLFALASGVVTLSARTATTPTELASDVRQRLLALARAHALTLSKSFETPGRTEHSATLHSLIQTIVAPYNEGGEQSRARVVVSGPDVPLADGSVIPTVEDGKVTLFIVAEHWNAEGLGWHVAKHGNRYAAAEALALAVSRVFGSVGADAARGVSVRHDHGSPFMSEHFQNQLTFFGMAPSFAFVRQPETNGVAERFIRTLKEQVVFGRLHQDIEEVRTAVRGYFERYNQHWLLQKNDYRSPAEARRHWMASTNTTQQAA